MRKLGIFVFALVLPAQAWALNTDDLLATIAMPLAVAAVANVSGVPQTQLADLVTTLNQANVPPTQFVQVIRYVPVALVDQNGEPFIAYVREETRQGVTGDALVNSIVGRLRSNYNVSPALTLSGEPTTIVVQDDYIPPMVTTRITTLTPTTTTTFDPLALIGLPLAVAAVSNITGVSQSELANLVSTLNNANVPVVQQIEIIRYAPVALVVDNGTPFVQFVQQQTTQGITGTALVPVIVQRLQTFYPAPTRIAVAAPAPPQRVVIERDIIPQVVVTRVNEVRAHPHGGPPGQLKKQLGLQTGAEVVHGGKRGRQVVVAPAPGQAPVVVGKEPRQGRLKPEGGPARQAPMISASPAPAPGKVKQKEHGGKEHGGGKGKGGGKGHGKD